MRAYVAPSPCSPQNPHPIATTSSLGTCSVGELRLARPRHALATTTPHPGIRFPMNTVGVGPGSNLQFFNMVIPDLNATLSGATNLRSAACTQRRRRFYNTPAQMAELAKRVRRRYLDGSLRISRSSRREPRSNQLQAAIPGRRHQLVRLKASSSLRRVVSEILPRLRSHPHRISRSSSSMAISPRRPHRRRLARQEMQTDQSSGWRHQLRRSAVT